jgi:hypothetical protein
MGELTRVTSAVRTQAADVSHISDLAIVDGQLYATSRYDGALESWTSSGNGLSLRDTQDHEGSLRPGDIGWITALDLNGGTQLLTGGGISGGLVLTALSLLQAKTALRTSIPRRTASLSNPCSRITRL